MSGPLLTSPPDNLAARVTVLESTTSSTSSTLSSLAITLGAVDSALSASITTLQTNTTVIEKAVATNRDFPADTSVCNWFASGTATVPAGRYEITANFDVSPNTGNTTPTKLMISYATTGTVVDLRSLVLVGDNATFTVASTRIDEVNNAVKTVQADVNYENKNIRGVIHGYVDFSTAGTMTPQFKWETAPGGGATSININKGTFWIMRRLGATGSAATGTGTWA